MVASCSEVGDKALYASAAICLALMYLLVFATAIAVAIRGGEESSVPTETGSGG